MPTAYTINRLLPFLTEYDVMSYNSLLYCLEVNFDSVCCMWKIRCSCQHATALQSRVSMTCLPVCHQPPHPPERSPKQRDDKSAKDERMSSRGPVILTWSRGSKWIQTCMTWQHILIFTDVQLWLSVPSAKATKHIVFWHIRGFCARVCVIIFAFAQGEKKW